MTQEFFYKSMAAVRKMRAMSGDVGSDRRHLGYGASHG
jgi:hypothetical protein